jgi:hypothetical protein
MSTLARARLMLVCGLFLAARCAGHPATPEDALKRFLADLNAHRTDAAWAALSQRSKSELKKQAEALASAAGEKPDLTPQALLDRTELMVLRAPESISIASPIGPEVMLRVSVKGGESANVHMIREGSDWKVDLVPSLQPAPPKPRTSTSTDT